VPERDTAGLAAAIGALLQQPALRASVGREGRERVCRDHSWIRVAEQFEAIYERIAM
jgi:starch synthase